MKILAIDTSGLQAGAAIVAENNSSYITVGEVFLNARTGAKSYTHSEILMPGVAQLFELTRLLPADIDFVAYTCGPGSFTGLRIGAACALGISRALKIPAIAVPTLDALAYNITGGGFVVPMLDARRGQVYTAFYVQNEKNFFSKKSECLALPIESAFEEISRFFLVDTGVNDTCVNEKKIFFLGDGADANAEKIKEAFPRAVFPHANNNRQRAASVAVCAAEKILRGEFSDKVEILYVRAPQAVREASQVSAK